MTSQDTSWRTGFAASQRPGASMKTVEIPAIYSPEQQCRFISGFLIGAKEKRDAELMELGGTSDRP